VLEGCGFRIRDFCVNVYNVLKSFKIYKKKIFCLQNKMYVWLVTISCEESTEEMSLGTYGEGGRGALT
jgi:hypothetical protein